MKLAKPLNPIWSLPHYLLGMAGCSMVLYPCLLCRTLHQKSVFCSSGCSLLVARSTYHELYYIPEDDEALRTLFGCYGLVEQLVFVNGPQFTSSDFIHCMHSNGIKHIRSPQYHPSSNGQVERFAQMLKRL